MSRYPLSPSEMNAMAEDFLSMNGETRYETFRVLYPDLKAAEEGASLSWSSPLFDSDALLDPEFYSFIQQRVKSKNEERLERQHAERKAALKELTTHEELNRAKIANEVSSHNEVNNVNYKLLNIHNLYF